MTDRYVASCSFGKDSLAMTLNLIARNEPLDEVVFFNTGWEYDAILNMRDQAIPIFEKHNIKFTELHPNEPFDYVAFEKPIQCRDGSGVHYGFSWCGTRIRWGTQRKVNIMKAHCGDAYQYVGIASDETDRIDKAPSEKKLLPLVKWGMTEADCLQYCYDHGFYWEEDGVRLYDVMDRVSCWCCQSKNRKELKNMYQYLPKYWEKLKVMQSKTSYPMKDYCNKKYGEYGNVFRMEEVFQQEISESEEGKQ